MKTFGKLWFSGRVALIFVGALLTIGAAAGSNARQPDPVRDLQYARVLEKAVNGFQLTEQDKRMIDEMMSAENVRNPRNPLDNQGGPDDFGYVFVDNQAGDTATYDWIELRGDAGASWIDFAQSHDDAVVSNVPLELTFPFYGINYTTANVSSNGDIQFGTTDNSYNNGTLPNAGFGQMGPAIFAYWDDLHLDYGGNGTNGNNTVARKNFGDYTVIEFDSIGHCCQTGTSLKFEIILYSSGNIKIQYNNMVFGQSTNSSTVGIQQNRFGNSSFLQYVNNGVPASQEPANGRAIWFALPAGVPASVTNLTGSSNGSTVTLNWTDPNQDTQGNPITLDSLLIYRGAAIPDSQIGYVNPGVQTIVISNAPNGNMMYFVRATSGAWHGAAAGVGVIVGTPSYYSNFESDSGGWVANTPWAWGTPSNTAAPSAHSGTHMWGTGMTTNMPSNVCSSIDLDPALQVTSSTATLEFWAWWSTYIWGPYDGCNVKVSVDGGDTWQLITPQGGYGTTISTSNACLPGQGGWAQSSTGWQYVILPIGQFINQMPIFRITFTTHIFSNNQYPGFFFDDVTLWGLSPRPAGIPQPVTNLTGSAAGTTVTLNWADPTQDMNGNPLTVDSILIYRGDSQPGSQIAHVGHGAQTITLTAQPQGYQVYYLRAKAGTQLGNPASTPVIVGSPAYACTFDTTNGGWTTDGNIWSWGHPTNVSAPLPHSGNNVWGTGVAANYPNNACTHADLDPALQVNSANATLEFWAWWSTYPGTAYDGCNIKASVDGGETWVTLDPQVAYGNSIVNVNTCMPGEDAWSMASGGWQYVVVPIGQLNGQIPIFRFMFSSYLVSGAQYAGFFFDDMTMWGLIPRPNGVPRPVTGFHGASNGTTTVTLNWTDPTQDMNGNPLTPDSILIYRGNFQPGSQVAHAAHGVQTVVVANEPQGNWMYYARAKAGTQLSYPVSAPVIVGRPSYLCTFDSTDGGWTADGVWSWGTPTNINAPQPHSGSNLWGTGLTGNYTGGQCGHLDLNLGQRVSSSTATLEFWAWWNTYGWAAFDGCNVKVSTDSGATWQALTPNGGYGSTILTNNTCNGGQAGWSLASNGWRYVVLPIGDFVNETPIFRFTFGTVLSGYPGFFLDDMMIWGLSPQQAVTGAVRHLGGANPLLANAKVWATGAADTVVTDANGNYNLPVDSAGTYTINFRHASHCDSIRPGIVVEANENTTLNVSLRAPNATLNVTSLTFVVRRFLTSAQTFTITNSGGGCPLHVQVLDSVTWLSSNPSADTVVAGQTDSITVTANPQAMPIGEYHTTMRVVCNAPGSPFLIQVDMNVLTAELRELGIPTEFALYANYPNPFNPTTVLPFDIPKQSQVDIIIYNVMGQEVARPVSGDYAAGRYQATFDAAQLPSGLYFAKMTAGHYTGMRKIMLLK